MFNIVYDVVITLFCVLSFIINTKFFKKHINYLNIFIGMYYIVIILSSLKIFGFTIPSNITYIYLLIALSSIEICSLIFLSIKTKMQPNSLTKNINKKLFTLIAIVVTILMIPSTLEGIKIFQTQGFTGIRSVAFSDEVYSTYTKLFFTHILNPINKAIFIYSLIEIMDKNKMKLPFMLSIINMIQCVLIFGGRAVLLDAVLLTIVIVYLKNNKNIGIIIKKHKKMAILVGIILLSMISITNDRNIKKNESIFFNIYSYYVGSIHLFNVHINNPEISLLDGKHLLFGKAMLSPFFDVGKMTIKTFKTNFDFKTGMEIINEQVQLFLNVDNRVTMNNNVTILYVCLRDFGIIGLILGPAYISLWYAMIYKLYIKKKNNMSSALYYYVCSILPYFIFSFQINNTVFLMNIIFIVLIYNICYRLKKGDKINEKD